MSNESLIKTVRGVTARDSGFSKNQAAFVIRALEGGSLTEAQKGHAIRCARRLHDEASKKEVKAKLEKVLALCLAAETRERYAHASTADRVAE